MEKLVGEFFQKYYKDCINKFEAIISENEQQVAIQHNFLLRFIPHIP